MSSTFRTRPVAEALARRGWPVLPCHHPDGGRCSCGDGDCASPAKHPRTRRGLHAASTDLAVIGPWWRQWPQANIAVRTGARPHGAGVVVLDIDPDHGGDHALAELVEAHGPLPETLAAATGGGGRHLWFAHPGGSLPNSAGRVGDGLDIRGDGGYALVSPSRHISGGRYRWLVEAPPAPMPDWLLTLARPPAPRPCPQPAARRHADAWARAAMADEIAAVRCSSAGSRNHALNRAAFSLGQLVGGGHLDVDDVTCQLTAAAIGAGLQEREVAATIASGLGAGIRQPRTRSTV